NIIIQKKSEVGIQLEIITCEINLVFYQIAIIQCCQQPGIQIRSSCIPSFIRVNCSKKSNEAAMHSPLWYLSGCFPFTGKNGCAEIEFRCSTNPAMIFSKNI